MSKKYLTTIIFVIVAVIIIVIITLVTPSPNSTPSAESGPNKNNSIVNIPIVVPTSTTSPTQQPINSYNMSQIAAHGNVQSCWTTINGNVYELTDWIQKHPGGAQAILSICGKDGTVAFTNQHDKQSKPADQLVNFKIGVLAQ